MATASSGSLCSRAAARRSRRGCQAARASSAAGRASWSDGAASPSRLTLPWHAAVDVRADTVMCVALHLWRSHLRARSRAHSAGRRDLWMRRALPIPWPC
jgi:hypothetical protein